MINRPWNYAKVEKICLTCSEKYLVSPVFKDSKFCSHKCYSISLKGKEHPMKPETRIKIRKKLIGNKNGLGFKHTEITKKHLSETKMGNKNPMYGKKSSKQTRKKMSNTHKKLGSARRLPHYRGKENPSWKGGITPLNHKIRTSTEYLLWRIAVFTRDNYSCTKCGVRGNTDLHADHVKPFALFPELRLAIDNGRTLCVDCHKKTKSYMNPRMRKEEFIYG